MIASVRCRSPPDQTFRARELCRGFPTPGRSPGSSGLREPPTLAELAAALRDTEEGRLLDRLREETVRGLLDAFFESEPVQAALLGNVDLRSLDAPGELLGLASAKPNMLVDPAHQGLVVGGMGALTAAMARAARAAGAVVRVGAEVRRILVDRGRAAGVELAGGATGALRGLPGAEPPLGVG